MRDAEEKGRTRTTEDGGEYDRDGKRTNERTYAWRRIRPRPPPLEKVARAPNVAGVT